GCAAFFGELRKPDRFARAVGARARHDLYSAPSTLHHGGHYALMFLMVQRRRFAGCAYRRQAIGSLLDVAVDQVIEFVEVDLTVPKRSNQGHGQARKLIASRGHRPPRSRSRCNRSATMRFTSESNSWPAIRRFRVLHWFDSSFAPNLCNLR